MNIDCTLIYKCKNCGATVEMPPTDEDRKTLLGIINGELPNTIGTPFRLHRCELKHKDVEKPDEFGVIEMLKVRVVILENAPEESNQKPL